MISCGAEMFFDDLKQIKEIVSRVGTAVVVLPDEVEFEIADAINVVPEERASISIDQMREVMARMTVRQTRDVFVVIRPAEALGLEAANASLKSFEEPGPHVHYVLVTNSPSALLPTILSRAAIYVLREKKPVDGPIKADKKVMDMARRLVTARAADLPQIAEEIAKKKDGVRAAALAILDVGVEMLYKSYFKTGKVGFLQKISGFIAAYEAISQGGNVKLHLVADLIS